MPTNATRSTQAGEGQFSAPTEEVPGQWSVGRMLVVVTVVSLAIWAIVLASAFDL